MPALTRKAGDYTMKRMARSIQTEGKLECNFPQAWISHRKRGEHERIPQRVYITCTFFDGTLKVDDDPDSNKYFPSRQINTSESRAKAMPSKAPNNYQ